MLKIHAHIPIFEQHYFRRPAKMCCAAKACQVYAETNMSRFCIASFSGII